MVFGGFFFVCVVAQALRSFQTKLADDDTRSFVEGRRVRVCVCACACVHVTQSPGAHGCDSLRQYHIKRTERKRRARSNAVYYSHKKAVEAEFHRLLNEDEEMQSAGF